MSDTILNIENITKSFPRVIANKKVTFDIKKNAVHAILGENGAGKSTLVKILYGLLEPDEGNIKLNNKDFKVNSPAEARKQGIGMVFQHFSLFDSLSVKENLILGIDEKMSYSDLENKLENISSRYNLPLDLDAPITALSAGEKQRVEIVRILLQDPQILIMDEPTSVLTPQEVESLFVTLNALVKEGRTILYITHKLEEVISICDTVTIMRSGEIIDTSSTANQTAKTLATKMLGQKLDDLKTNYGHIKDEVNFEVKNISCDFNDPFLTDLKNISFQVRVGEIYGIAGVAGNGQVELMNALSGETLGDPDEIIFEDKKIGNTNIKFRRSLGLEFVPEERNGHATVPDITLTENTFLTFYNAYSKNNNFLDNILLSSNMSSKDSISIINDNDVRCPYSNPLADQLSGGNLQKFIVGRSLKANPKVLIISQPTWGVDIGAASEIRSKLLLLAKAGKAIILISQDLDEIYEISNKICVINNGSLSTPKITSKISATDIGILMGIN